MQHQHPAAASQTQTTEVPTQTQPDDDELQLSSSSPLVCRESPASLVARQRRTPWGRLMPCSTAADSTNRGSIDLLPRHPLEGSRAKKGNGTGRQQQQQQRDDDHPMGGVNVMGLHNILPSDRFNEYVLGRSPKCDVRATQPVGLVDDMDKARHDWAFGMISNRHCRIFCCLDSSTSAEQQPSPASTCLATSSLPPKLLVYVEDCSGNGTVVNKSVLLRKGEKRLLHTGDEISLVNPTTLRKKVRSQQRLHELVQHHSYIFVDDVKNTMMMMSMMMMPPQSSSVGSSGLFSSSSNSAIVSSRSKRKNSISPPSSNKQHYQQRQNPRKAAVDVRATKQHSWPAGRCGEHRSPGAVHNSTAKGKSRGLSPSTTPSSRLQARLSAAAAAASPARTEGSDRRVEEDYDIRDILGTGTVGEVRRAIHRRTGIERAVKVINIGGRNRTAAATAAAAAAMAASGNKAGKAIWDQVQATLQAEATILRGLEHPYVVKLIDVYLSTTAVHLVLELVPGGDLFDRIVEKGKYTEVESRRVFRRLLSAIYYLHEERNIVHRDLKPENILCIHRTNDVDVKLTDFGLAKSVNANEGLKTFCGTPQYFAPEVLRRRNTVTGRGRYGKQADMWSMGVILYILLSGTPPFDASLGLDMVERVNIEFPEEHWEGVSDAAKDLIRRLLVTDPSRRISAREACSHPWVLIDDGDSHCHPLDDPKLQSKSRGDNDVDKNRHIFVNALEEAVAEEGSNRGKEASSSPDKSSNVEDMGGEAKLENNLSSMDSKVFLSNNAKDANPVKKTVLDDEAPPSGEITSSTETSPPPRCPFSPVSLNSNQDGAPKRFSPNILSNQNGVDSRDGDEGVGDDSPCAQELIAAKRPLNAKETNTGKAMDPPSLSFAPSFSIRPGTVDDIGINLERPKAIVAACPKSLKPTTSDRLELSDDEVFSRFSENTESISSFSTGGGSSFLPQQPGVVASSQNSDLDRSDAGKEVVDGCSISNMNNKKRSSPEEWKSDKDENRVKKQRCAAKSVVAASTKRKAARNKKTTPTTLSAKQRRTKQAPLKQSNVQTDGETIKKCAKQTTISGFFNKMS